MSKILPPHALGGRKASRAASGEPALQDGLDPIDLHLGARLRTRRNVLGISQEQLGIALGLTFQQIQKYERGVNRINAGRLFRLAVLLKVPVAYFFEGLPEVLNPTEYHVSSGMAEEAQQDIDTLSSVTNTTIIPTDAMERRETFDIIRAYYRITDPKQRKRVYEIIKAMADSQAK